jgi:arylsulfatase
MLPAPRTPAPGTWEWIAKFGRFDDDVLLRGAHACPADRAGVVPPGTKLAPKPKAIKDWDQLTPLEQKLFAHQMEVFAVSLPRLTTRSAAS